MQRNTIFGAAALLVAGAAIGAGSVVSQNAMADTGSPAKASEITMVNIGPDGKAVQCTFSGADAEGLLPAGVPADAHMVMGSAQITTVDGSLPELQLPPDGQLPEGAQVVTGLAGSDTGPAGMVINGEPADVHDGTAEECAAIHAQAVEMAKHIPAGGTVISGTDGVVSGGAGVVTVTADTRP